MEDLSKFENKADLKFANEHIAAHRVAGAAQMLDLEHFIKLHAMEFYLKHWDGYAGNTNNTYIYNDVTAVETPGVNNVKFKMIPWGIDQTFQPERPFKLGLEGLIAKLVRNDAARRKQLIDQVRTYRKTVFRPRDPADGAETIDQQIGGTTRRIRCAQCGNGDRDGPPAIAVGRIGRLSLCWASPRQCGLYPRGVTPVNASTPATPRGFRRVHPIR